MVGRVQKMLTGSERDRKDMHHTLELYSLHVAKVIFYTKVTMCGSQPRAAAGFRASSITRQLTAYPRIIAATVHSEADT